MLAERDQLLSEMYGELRAAAARMLRRDAPALTMQPTELVNEAALRIVKLEQMSFNDRQHFFATGARIVEMRFFVGLKPDEIAIALGISASTVKRRWQTARLWLASELAEV